MFCCFMTGAIKRTLTGNDLTEDAIINASFLEKMDALPSAVSQTGAADRRRKAFSVMPFLTAALMLAVIGLLNRNAVSLLGLDLLMTAAVPLALISLAQLFIVGGSEIDLGIGAFAGLISVISATFLVSDPALGWLFLALALAGYMALGLLVQCALDPGDCRYARRVLCLAGDRLYTAADARRQCAGLAGGAGGVQPAGDTGFGALPPGRRHRRRRLQRVTPGRRAAGFWRQSAVHGPERMVALVGRAFAIRFFWVVRACGGPGHDGHQHRVGHQCRQLLHLAQHRGRGDRRLVLDGREHHAAGNLVRRDQPVAGRQPAGTSERQH